MHPPSKDNQQRPTQFSLRWVFALTTGVAVLLGAIHWLGAATIVIPIFVFVMILLAANLVARHKRLAATIGLGLVGVTTLNCMMDMWSNRHVRSRSPRSMCNTNLLQIGLALQAYAEVYGSFPPAFVADGSGRPMHSWRVLILPFIEQRDLYRRYDFNEPWDGPHNRSLAREIPPCFRCPTDAIADYTSTSYVAVSGAQTAWPDTETVSLDEVSDGLSETLAVVEVAHSGINWMEPRDLPFSALDLGINPPMGAGVSSEHPHLAQVLFCDGTVHALESPISVKTLKALATKSGGEKIDEEY